MHAFTAVSPSTGAAAAAIGRRAPQHTTHRRSSSSSSTSSVVVVVVARAADSPLAKRDASAAGVSPCTRRGVLFGVGGLAAAVGMPLKASAVAPPTTPDASTSPYIQGLLAKTEANKDRCVRLSCHSSQPPAPIHNCQRPSQNFFRWSSAVFFIRHTHGRLIRPRR